MFTRRERVTRWARWTATFIGFPLTGIAARLVGGDIDTAGSAVAGGIAAGAVLGATQAFIGGIVAGRRDRWIVATAAAFGVGLTVGAATVDFRTDAASLVLMGAICGIAVGLAQALSTPMRQVDRVLWAVVTPGLWALGWLVTSQVIVDADRRHAVFGSSGALMVSAVAGVIYAYRRTVEPTTTYVAGSNVEVAS